MHSTEKLDYEKLKEELNTNNTYWLDRLVGGGKIYDGEYRASNIHGGNGRSFSYDLGKNIFKDHVDSSIGRGKHGIFGLYQQQHPEAKPHEVFAFFEGTPVDHKKAEVLKTNVKKKEKIPTTYFKRDLDQQKLLARIEKHNLQYVKRNQFKFGKNYHYVRPDKTIAYVMTRYYDAEGNKQIRPISAKKLDGTLVTAGVTPDKFIPYNLDDIMADKTKPILIVEGEKAADFIKPIIKDKFIVTTFTYGAGTISKLDQQGLRHFKGRKVFLWPDKDEKNQGYEAFKLTAQTLKDMTESVALVDVSKISQLTFKDNDLADLVSNGKIKTYDDFFKMLTGDLRTTDEPRKVQVSEIQDISGEQMATFGGNAGENLMLINTIQNKDKAAASAMGKLTEAVIFDILEADVLDFDIYRDLFTDTDVVEYKHKNGTSRKTNLKCAEPMILTQLQRLGFKVQRQCVGTALSTFALESITEKDTLKEATLKYKEFYDPSYKADQFFQTYYGVKDNDYHKMVSTIFLQNMISCWIGDELPNDFCIVLAGGQGHGKGRLGEILAGGNEYVGEMSGKNMDDSRTLKTELNNTLAVQFSEFEKQGKQGVNALKRFISLTTFKYNKKYSEEEGVLKIRAFKYITTNDFQIFSDTTGNRRFGIIETRKAALADLMVKDRNKIIASALHLYETNMEKGITHNKLCMEESFTTVRDDYLSGFADRHELYEPMLEWFTGFDRDLNGTFNEARVDVRIIDFMKAMDSARGSSYPVTKKSEATELLHQMGCLRNKRTYKWNLPSGLRNLKEYNTQV